MDQRTFSFKDLDDGGETTVIVRRVDGGVGLALSKRANGDLEASIPLVEAQRLADGLREVAESGHAESPTSRALGSATWWGLPGLAGIFLGIEELASGTVGWGVLSILIGAVLLAVARARYRAQGHL